MGDAGRADSALDRRMLLGTASAAGIAALLGGCATNGPAVTSGLSAAPPEAAGLHAIGTARNINFGSAVAWAPPGVDAASFTNPAYAALLRAECGVLVAENEMKWQALRPSARQFDFARFDAMAAWAMEQGMKLRGHTLLWHYDRWFPEWLNSYDYGARPVAEAERLLATHVRTVTERYGTRIASYDVVNEAVDPDTGILRETSLSRAAGSAEAVLDLAFRTARAHAPHAELVYNDYMSWEPGNERHQEGVLKLLQGFRTRGTPVDALGVQSHLAIFDSGVPVPELVQRQGPAWRAFLDAVVAMGYRLVITELDTRDRGLPADTATRDAGVAAYTGGYLDLMLSYPQLTDVIAWGLSDRHGWLRGFDPRPDGLPTRGLPYDSELRAKPMRAAIARAFTAALVRPAR